MIQELDESLAFFREANKDGALEICVFLILCVITVFRKELSCNVEYMDEKRRRDAELLSPTNARKAAAHAATTTVTAASQAKAAAQEALETWCSAAASAALAAAQETASTYSHSPSFAATSSFAVPFHGGAHPRVGLAHDTPATPQSPIQAEDADQPTRGATQYGRMASTPFPTSRYRHTRTDAPPGLPLWLDKLPHDGALHVLGFLECSSLLPVAATSRLAAQLCDSDLPEGCAWRDQWLNRFGHIWSTPVVQSALVRHGVSWSPSPRHHGSALSQTSSLPAPAGGTWRRFYYEFDEAWLDWALVGLNTPDRCHVALYGTVYNLTEFQHEHPGSAETLIDNAGGDATAMFEGVGHSRAAQKYMAKLVSIEALPPLSRRKGTLAEARRMLDQAVSSTVTPGEENTVLLASGSDPSAGRLVSLPGYSVLSEREKTFYKHLAEVCHERGEHCGRCRVFYDPFTCNWRSWWSCCYALDCTPSIDTAL